MKILTLLLAFILVCCALKAQADKFNWNIEYTPNFSKLTSPVNPQTNFSQQIFGRAEWNISRRLSLTAGIGYLNARDRVTLYNIQFGSGKIDLYTNHDYFTIPLGLKYVAGPWYIRPEIGMGMNFAQPGRMMRQVVYLQNGKTEVIRWDDFNQRNYNDLTFPISLA